MLAGSCFSVIATCKKFQPSNFYIIFISEASAYARKMKPDMSWLWLVGVRVWLRSEFYFNMNRLFYYIPGYVFRRLRRYPVSNRFCRIIKGASLFSIAFASASLFEPFMNKNETVKLVSLVSDIEPPNQVSIIGSSCVMYVLACPYTSFSEVCFGRGRRRSFHDT